MADFDRYLAACEDRHAQRLLDDDDPEMAAGDDDRMTRLDRLATDAEARWESDRDNELTER
jgi:hypothetical protein